MMDFDSIPDMSSPKAFKNLESQIREDAKAFFGRSVVVESTVSAMQQAGTPLTIQEGFTKYRAFRALSKKVNFFSVVSKHPLPERTNCGKRLISLSL